MNKHIKKDLPKQLELLPPESAFDKLDNRVRRVIINSEEYVSVLDLLQYHGNKKNPSDAWKKTLAFMTGKQGSQLGSSDLREHKFEGKGQRRTPIVNIKGFLRFVQSTEVPEWEFIREWLAKTGANELKSRAARKRDKTIEMYERAGYGDTPEIIRLKARADSIKTLETFKGLVNALVDNPNWRDIFNQEYIELFGATAKEIITINGGNSARENLPTLQLDTIAFAEKRLIEILRLQKQGLSNERVLAAIELAVRPLGVYLRDLCEALGINHISGKPLLSSGK